MSGTTVSSEMERASLCEFLDYQREALIDKLQGLSDVEARMEVLLKDADGEARASEQERGGGSRGAASAGRPRVR